MKKGEIKKFIVKNFNEEREYVGVVCEVLTAKAIIFTTKGQTLAFSFDKVVSEKSTRLPAETRTMLKNFVKLYDKEAKLREELSKVQSEKKSIGPAELAKSMGLLSNDEFVDVFINNLEVVVRDLFSKMSFRAEIWDYNAVPCLEIESNKYIEKYFRKGSFVFEEYDGTIMMCTDAEKDENYKKYVRKHRRDLPIKAKAKVELSLGDKDWLICTTSYKIDLTKPLTEKYAKELAEKFSR